MPQLQLQMPCGCACLPSLGCPLEAPSRKATLQKMPNAAAAPTPTSEAAAHRYCERIRLGHGAAPSLVPAAGAAAPALAPAVGAGSWSHSRAKIPSEWCSKSWVIARRLASEPLPSCQSASWLQGVAFRSNPLWVPSRRQAYPPHHCHVADRLLRRAAFASVGTPVSACIHLILKAAVCIFSVACCLVSRASAMPTRSPLECSPYAPRTCVSRCCPTPPESGGSEPSVIRTGHGCVVLCQTLWLPPLPARECVLFEACGESPLQLLVGTASSPQSIMTGRSSSPPTPTYLH